MPSFGSKSIILSKLGKTHLAERVLKSRDIIPEVPQPFKGCARPQSILYPGLLCCSGA